MAAEPVPPTIHLFRLPVSKSSVMTVLADARFMKIVVEDIKNRIIINEVVILFLFCI